MLKLPVCAAVIFDLDGLVLDSEPGYFAAWQQALQQLGYPCPQAFCHSLSGLSGDAIVNILLREYGTDFPLSKFGTLSKQCWQQWITELGIPIKPGFERLHRLLLQHNLPFALATNSPSKNARAALTQAGLHDVFSIIIAREDVAQGKPAPDVFLLAAQRLDIAIQDCLILEDSYHGILAAHHAGAASVYIPSTTEDPHCRALASGVAEDLEQVAIALQSRLPEAP